MKGDLKQQRLDPRSAAKGKLGGAQKARQCGGTLGAPQLYTVLNCELFQDFECIFRCANCFQTPPFDYMDTYLPRRQ